jgi:hypothetical protein
VTYFESGFSRALTHVKRDGVREPWLRGRRFGRSHGVTERSARSIDDEVIGDVKDVARLIAVQAGDQG